MEGGKLLSLLVSSGGRRVYGGSGDGEGCA